MDLQKADAQVSLANVFELNDEALEKVVGGRSEHRGDEWGHRGDEWGHRGDGWDYRHDNGHDWNWDWRRRGHDWNWDWRRHR
jgi:hypothetical protein